jgi:hypothetical protein
MVEVRIFNLIFGRNWGIYPELPRRYGSRPKPAAKIMEFGPRSSQPGGIDDSRDGFAPGRPQVPFQQTLKNTAFFKGGSGRKRPWETG